MFGYNCVGFTAVVIPVLLDLSLLPIIPKPFLIGSQNYGSRRAKSDIPCETGQSRDIVQLDMVL
jgi:hypothetical protein